jgi:hypothetical protein
MKKFIVFLIILMVSMLGYSHAKSSKIKTDHFRITYEDISPDMAKHFSEKAEKAFSDVTTYLGKKYKGKIRIRISDKYRIPRTKDGEIYMPANRIRGDAGGPPEIAGRGPAIAHEITHIIAPSRGKPNRYLDEGLGVFIQEKFGGDRSYPNMGEDVHKLTARLIRLEGEITPLKNAEKVRMSSKSGPKRRLAYLQEGSFARYLIEKYGLENFMTMYRGKSYKKVSKILKMNGKILSKESNN